METRERNITSDQEPGVELLGRMSGDLADVEAAVLAGQVGHHQPPVVGVAVGGHDAAVPSVGDVAHSQEVRRGEGRVAEPGDLTTLSLAPSRHRGFLSYRFFLFEKDPAVQSDVVPVPQLHPGVVLLLEVCREDSLFGLAQHAVQPGGVSQLAGGDGGLRISLEIKILI